jgi:hypothetical protein
MLFDWLITGQGVSMNPAAAVRGPKHVVNEGKMPVLGGPEWGAADRQHPDRARIATFTYSFARIDAASSTLTGTDPLPLIRIDPASAH